MKKMSFHVIMDQETNGFLGRLYKKEVYYSTLTGSDESEFYRCYLPLQEYLNDRGNTGLVIFENKYSADLYIKNVLDRCYFGKEKKLMSISILDLEV